MRQNASGTVIWLTAGSWLSCCPVPAAGQKIWQRPGRFRSPLWGRAPGCRGLCRPGGLVLAIKGASAARELARARPVLRRLGAADVEIVTAGTRLAGLVQQPTTVIRFRTRGVPE